MDYHEEETTMHAADSLARVIFMEAHPPASVHLSMPCLRCSKQLFFLLLDLFIRGLAMLFSDSGGGGIAVHEITAEQFDTLAAKLGVAGIECRRCSAEDPSVRAASTNIDELIDADDDLPLESYRLRIDTRGFSHSLWFRIVHNVGPQACDGGVIR